MYFHGITLLSLVLVSSVSALTRHPVVPESPQDTHNYLELVNMSRVMNQIGENNGLSLRLSTTKMASSGMVTVSWEGVLDPTTEDWIGVFVAPLDLKSTPTKYRACTAAKSHLTEGKGAIDLHILNMRHDITFVYLTNGTDFPIAIAQSEILTFSNPNEPLQGHLALTHDHTQMRVTWTTRDVGSPLVRYGQSPSAMDHTVTATTATYGRADMCGAPANETGWMEPGVFHSAVMTHLAPHTRYYYTYGDASFGMSNIKSFLSPPQPGPESSFTFIAFGDMGQAETDGWEEQSYEAPALNTTRLMGVDADNGAELLIHIGDISYARGYSSQWDVFMAQIGPNLAQRMPYMTAIGNHERDFPNSGSLYTGTDSGGECGVAYGKRFPMPTPALDQPWYSFEYGPVHFVMISTEHAFGEGSAQYKYIEKDLASVDRKKTPWLIVGGHRPMYIDSINNDPDGGDLSVARDLRRAYEGMFLKYRVDMFLGGHHHSYQRSCPLDRRVCLGYRSDGSARAPVYMVIGMAGMGLCTNVHRIQTWFIEKRDIEHYGHTRSFVNSTHLNMEFISDVDGKVLDSFWLVQPKDLAAALDEEPGQILLTPRHHQH